MNVANTVKIAVRATVAAGVIYGGYKVFHFTKKAMIKSEINHKAAINRLVLNIEVLARRLNVKLNETDLLILADAKIAVTINDYSPERLVLLGDIEEQLKGLVDWLVHDNPAVETPASEDK